MNQKSDCYKSGYWAQSQATKPEVLEAQSKLNAGLRRSLDDATPEEWDDVLNKYPPTGILHTAGHEESDSALDTQVGGSHYKDMKLQPIEYILANDLSYCEANIVKYITRHRAKGGRQDVEKVIHYAQLLLETEYDDRD